VLNELCLLPLLDEVDEKAIDDITRLAPPWKRLCLTTRTHLDRAGAQSRATPPLLATWLVRALTLSQFKQFSWEGQAGELAGLAHIEYLRDELGSFTWKE
jgi:hypothetical protein